MSGRVKGNRTGSRGEDIASRAVRDYAEVERIRAARIRTELIQRGAVVDTRSVEKLLEEAAPRLRDKGWRVTKEER